MKTSTRRIVSLILNLLIVVSTAYVYRDSTAETWRFFTNLSNVLAFLGCSYASWFQNMYFHGTPEAFFQKVPVIFGGVVGIVIFGGAVAWQLSKKADSQEDFNLHFVDRYHCLYWCKRQHFPG